MVGCGADVGDGAAGDSAEIGSTSEALTLSGNAKADIQFFGSIKLDSAIQNANGHTDNLELIAGGMDRLGALTAKIQVYDRETDTLKPLRNAGDTLDVDLPTALVEPVIAKIPNTTNVYLIAGGRTSRDSTTSALSYILTLTISSNKIASAKIKQIGQGGMIDTGTALPSGRVFNHKGIKQCGLASNQKLVAFGGTTSASGFQSLTSLGATTEIMVLTYHSGNDGGDSDWDALVDNANPVNKVLLRTGRGYPEVMNKTANDFYIAGGLNAGAIALSTVDHLAVSDSCVADVNHLGTPDEDLHVRQVEAGTAMPAALARFASIQLDPFTVSSVAYDFIVGGGNNTGSYVNNTALPTATYIFDPEGNSGLGAWATSGTSIQEGRVFPRFVAKNRSGSNTDLDGINLPTVVSLVTGIMPQSTAEATNRYYNTSLVNDVFTGSTGAWTTGTALAASKDRVGVFADLVKNNTTLDPVVGFGVKHTATTGTSGVDGTSAPSDVISVP